MTCPGGHHGQRGNLTTYDNPPCTRSTAPRPRAMLRTVTVESAVHKTHDPYRATCADRQHPELAVTPARWWHTPPNPEQGGRDPYTRRGSAAR